MEALAENGWDAKGEKGKGLVEQKRRKAGKKPGC